MTSVSIFKVLGVILHLGKNVNAYPTPISNHTIILVVAFDGFGADYFNKAATPVLDALMASGVRVPYMEPVFPTFTFPNMQSIATGLNVEEHGIVDNEVFDPKFNQKFNGFEDEPNFWNYSPDVIPIWIRNEMAGEGRTSGCLYWPGCTVPYGHKKMLPTYYHPGHPSYVEFPPWEHRVKTVISWMTNPKKPANLVFLYYSQPDSVGHAFGPNSPQIVEEIKKTDNRAAYLIQNLKDAGIFERVNLIMLSDHGCAEVSSKISLNKFTHESSHVIDRILFRPTSIQLNAKKGKLEDLYKVLQKLSNSYKFTVWKKENMRQSHFYTTSRRIMDLVLVADPGHEFVEDVFGDLEYQVEHKYGSHGYDNAHPSMRPFFLAHGPAFRRGLNHPPFKNVDIVPMICKIMGIAEPPNNGSLHRVSKMINPSYLSVIL